jgi:hypothetical protein
MGAFFNFNYNNEEHLAQLVVMKKTGVMKMYVLLLDNSLIQHSNTTYFFACKDNGLECILTDDSNNGLIHTLRKDLEIKYEKSEFIVRN